MTVNLIAAKTNKNNDGLWWEEAIPMLEALNGEGAFREPSPTIVFLLSGLQRIQTICATLSTECSASWDLTCWWEGGSERAHERAPCNCDRRRSDELQKEGARILEQINWILEGFPTFPVIVGLGSSGLRFMQNHLDEEDGRRADEYISVKLILDEFGKGRLDHFRRCRNCKRWLQKESPDQELCWGSCKPVVDRPSEKGMCRQYTGRRHTQAKQNGGVGHHEAGKGA